MYFKKILSLQEQVLVQTVPSGLWNLRVVINSHHFSLKLLHMASSVRIARTTSFQKPLLFRVTKAAAVFSRSRGIPVAASVLQKPTGKKVKTRMVHEMPGRRHLLRSAWSWAEGAFSSCPGDYNSPTCTKFLPNCSPGSLALMATRAHRQDLLFIPGNAPSSSDSIADWLVHVSIPTSQDSMECRGSDRSSALAPCDIFLFLSPRSIDDASEAIIFARTCRCWDTAHSPCGTFESVYL